jgi:predicted ATPase
MIVSIKIQNFLSFGNETTVTLRPDTNLLAGINGSGKSNFIKAVRLLQAAVTEKNGLQSLFAQWGGIDEVMNVGENVEEMILTYELDKNVLGAYGQPWEQNIFYTIQIKKVSDKNSRFEDKYFLQFDTIKVEIKYDKMAYYSTDNDFFVDSLTKRITLNLINKTDPLLTIRTAIENIDIYDYFDTSPKSPLRKPIMDTSFENKLVSGGFNRHKYSIS